MIVILLALLMALFVAGGQIKKYIDFKKFLKSYEDEKQVEIHVTPRKIISYIFQSLPVVVCILIGAYIYINPSAVDDPRNYILAMAMFAIIFSSTIFTGEIYQRVYYTDKGFIWDNKNIFFKTIKSLSSRNLKAATVNLKDGTSIKISRKYFYLLKDIVPQYNAKVKIEI